MIDTIYSDPNFLQHYGVKGMKWGVRHDEPAKGWRRKARKRLTDKQKKTMKTIATIGAVAAVTGLAIYGAKTLSSVGINESVLGLTSELENHGIKTGKSYVDDFMDNTFVDKDGLTKLKDFNPNFAKGSNCYAASLELQFKEMFGYEVTAKEVQKDTVGKLIGRDPKLAYNDVYSDFETISKKNAQAGMDAVKSQLKNRLVDATSGKDSVGGIILHGTKADGTTKGHTISWRLKNGDFKLIDSDGALNRDYSSSFANGSWSRDVEFYIADKNSINWKEVKEYFLE